MTTEEAYVKRSHKPFSVSPTRKKALSDSDRIVTRIYKIDDKIGDAFHSDLICHEDYESDFCFYPYQDEIKGHYSYYFEDDTSELLPSQYLEKDVDSYVDCNGDG